ncbi:MAG: MATE family efflux transporter [Alphaproteobacteria bacterium]|nr:MATE family efflux transporter [Alphaproteobacteria bacterium]
MFSRSAFLPELRALLSVAAPLAAANLAQMALGVTNTVMIGHLGGAQLAAAGLGGGFYFTMLTICQGMLSAVAPLAAHAIGAGDRRVAGRIALSGVALTALLSPPLVLGLTQLESLLHLLGYDPALAGQVGAFLRAIAWGAPASLGFAVARSFLAATGHARAVMLVLVLSIPTNAALNWALIFGHFGLPAWGVVGAGRAIAIDQWLIFGLIAAHTTLARNLAAYRAAPAGAAAALRDIRDILVLGWPIGGILGLEIGVFVTTNVVMGLLGTDALGAHQIVSNCSGLTFMVPLGIGQAATVRVAIRLGAGEPAAARRAWFLALALGIAFMSGAAILLWSAPRAMIAIYLDIADPDNRGMAAIAMQLIAVAALFQVFDGVQTIAAGALRGYKDTAAPLVLAAIGYWAIGFAGGLLFAFPLHQGAVGLWRGLALGLGAVALLLTLRLAERARYAGTAAA